MAIDVSTPSAEHNNRQEQWARARALLGGTKTMRAAGKVYLPMFEAEQQDQWRRRLNVTVLHAGFAQNIKTMSGLPFAKPINFSDDALPELIGTGGAWNVRTGGYIEDIDCKGNRIEVFAKRVFAEGLALGSSGILVDMPADAPTTARDDMRRRPRWIHYRPEQIIDARTGEVGGKERFVHLRLLETRREVDGYQETFAEQIREIEPGLSRVWRKDSAGKWQVVSEGGYDLDFVAFAPFLAGQDRGIFSAGSPLENCQHLNIAHWQSSSDQRNILTFSRFAMLFVKGGGADGIKLGPMTVLSTDEEFGDAKILEPTGSAIQAGERDLEKLEAAMEAEGLKMLVRRPGNVTATEMVIDESKDQSELEALAVDFSDCLSLAAGYTALWLGRSEEEGGTVRVSQDFGVNANAAAIKDTVLKLRELGDLAAEDALEELQRAGLLSDALNIDEALERAANEMARTLQATMGGAGGAERPNA